METLTIDKLKTLSSGELRKAASQLKVKNYGKYKKPDLLKECEKQLGQEEESKDDAVKAILESVNISKSEKMRMLYDRNLRPIQISKLLKAHYSFVYGVIQRYIDKTEEENKS